MLHEWSDDEKMTFAWALGKALWRRRHMGTEQVVRSPQVMSVGMGCSQEWHEVIWLGHIQGALEMYCRAVL